MGVPLAEEGSAAPRVILTPTVEKLAEDVPDLADIMPCSFPMRRSVGESSSSLAHPAQERIRGSLHDKDVQVYRKVSPESLIGWIYSFSDFVSE